MLRYSAGGANWRLHILCTNKSFTLPLIAQTYLIEYVNRIDLSLLYDVKSSTIRETDVLRGVSKMTPGSDEPCYDLLVARLNCIYLRANDDQLLLDTVDIKRKICARSRCLYYHEDCSNDWKSAYISPPMHCA